VRLYLLKKYFKAQKFEFVKAPPRFSNLQVIYKNNMANLEKVKILVVGDSGQWPDLFIL
jgi:hypothetical protein